MTNDCKAPLDARDANAMPTSDCKADGPLRIERARSGGRWQAVIVREHHAPEVTTLHQLIRWRAALSAGSERPPGGLR